MNSIGRTFEDAFNPKTKEEMDQMARQTLCAACGSSEFEFLDWKDPNQAADLHFQELQRKCVCGFTTRNFFLLNDLMFNAVPSKDALKNTMTRGLLPSARHMLISTRMMVAIHQGELDRGISIALELAELEPGNPEAWYQLAILYTHLELWEESVDAYEKVNAIMPELYEAWLDKAKALVKLKRKDEAETALVFYHSFKPSKDKKGVRDLAKITGMFGEIAITELEIVRSLSINGQTQGGLLLHPETLEPTPLPSSFYTIAWLIAGAHYPNGKGLMLGLGSGMGAVSLLTSYPGLTLTVIEADPAIIELSRKWFPHVSEFEQMGRLTIHQADAKEWVANNSQKRDFLMLDIYSGQRNMPDWSYSTDFIKGLTSISPQIWINLIGRTGEAYLTNFCASFENAGATIRSMTAAPSQRVRATAPVNWLASTVAIIRENLTFPTAFDHLKHLAEPARVHFQSLINHQADANEMDQIKGR